MSNIVPIASASNTGATAGGSQSATADPSVAAYVNTLLEMAQALQDCQNAMVQNQGDIMGLDSIIGKSLLDNAQAALKKLKAKFDEMDKARESAKISDIFMKIFGAVAILAGAIITALTAGAGAAVLVAAIAVTAQLGGFEKMTNAICEALGYGKDGKDAPAWLKGVIGLITTIVIVALTCGAGAAASVSNIASTAVLVTIAALGSTNTLGNLCTAAATAAFGEENGQIIGQIVGAVILFLLAIASCKFVVSNNVSFGMNATQAARCLTVGQVLSILGSLGGGVSSGVKGGYELLSADLLEQKADIDSIMVMLAKLQPSNGISTEALKSIFNTFNPIWQEIVKLNMPLQATAEELLA